MMLNLDNFQVVFGFCCIFLSQRLVVGSPENASSKTAPVNTSVANFTAYPFKEQARTERISHMDVEKGKTVIAAVGESVDLQCEFPASPWSYIQWIKIYFTEEFEHLILDGKQAFTNTSTVISSVSLNAIDNSDAGNYSCIAANALGTSALEFRMAVKDKRYCENMTICGSFGNCEELVDGYKCHCVPGHTGNHCETLDLCFSEPCMNKGSCSRSEDGFNCTCTEGFKGDLCEKRACLSTTCNNGGVCSETSDGNITCVCDNAHAGAYCQHHCKFRKYSCNPETCVIEPNGRESCYCEGNHFDGKVCMMREDVTDECRQGSQCGLGTCYERVYKYECICNYRASGANCEIYDECRSGDWNNCWKFGGKCVDQPIGYRCNCPDNQYGDICQYSSKPCNVTCNTGHMTVTCDMEFINTGLQRIRFKSNAGKRQCIFPNVFTDRNYGYGFRHYFHKIFSAEINYADCETEVEFKGDYVVYRNTLNAGRPTSTKSAKRSISRKNGYFLFEMECKQPLDLKKTQSAVYGVSLAANETSKSKDVENISVRASTGFYDSKWNSLSSFFVGERLYVKVGLSSPLRNDLLTDVVLLLKTCYVSSPSSDEEDHYMLIENGCAKDDTFRYEERSPNDEAESPLVYFSFQSFSFGDERNKLLLNCFVRLCVNGTDSASLRNKDQCLNTCQDESKESSESKPDIVNAT